MNTAPDSGATLPKKYPLLIFLTLVAAGLAANYFKYELFFNIQFIFGSVFALLALQILGFGPGILAAALVSSITYLLWNHPYAIIIMTAEVITVGWLSRRKGLGLVLACAIYWLCLGMPLVYLFYHGVMHLPQSNALITMAKQALNGVANALAARLLFMAISLRSQKTTFSFREIIFHLLTLFVLGPSMVVLIQESRIEFADTDQGVQSSLLHSSNRTAYNLEQWLDGHLALISHLAKMATTNEPSALQKGIEEIHSDNQDFLRIGLLDQNATVVAISPLIDELGQPNLGRNFADRPWIPTLKQTLQPLLSEVVMGRIDTPQPVVSMLAPVVRGGVYAGYAIGVFNLKGLLKVIEIETADQGMNFTLLDRNGKVIISNRPELKIMEAFSREAGDLQTLDRGIDQWIPHSKKNISISERWKKSSYIKEITIGAMAEWKLILEQPLAPFQEKLYKRYSAKLGLLLVVLAIALMLAELISRKIMLSLERLNALSTDLPQKLVATEVIAWPGSAVLETANLFANFRSMATALSDKFHEIKELNANLESLVQRRTREALQLASRYQTLMLTASDGLHVLDEQGNVIEANDSFCRMLGYSREEVSRLNVRDWDVNHSPEEILTTIPKLIQHPALFTTRHRRKDGEVREVEINAGGVVIDGHPYLFNAARDITDRKQAEKEREQFFTFFQTSTDMMCIAAPNGTFLKTNPASTELLGYSAEELAARPFIDFVHPDDKQPTLDEIVRQRQCGYTLNFENRYLCKDGSYRWLAWRANYNKDEDITYATARDITKRKQAEEALVRAVKEKEVMLKEIHHRVKNNMQVIYSLLNLQAKGIADSTVRAMFEESRNRVNSMALIHEKLYRSEDLAYIDFKEYLQSLIVGIADTYNRHDIAFVVDMDPLSLDINIGIPCGLIINELVSNSLKHAFPAGRKGTITLGINKDREGQNVLTVADNGIGFPAGLDFKNTASLGMQLVTVLAGQLNGTVELLQDDETKFIITFPGS